MDLVMGWSWGGLWGWCCNGTRGLWGWEWDGACYGMGWGSCSWWWGLVMGLAQWGLDPGRTEAGGAEGHIPGSLSPPVRDGGPAGCPPSSPCPFCAPSPKALSSFPSSLHGDPGAFPVSPAAVGPFRGNSHGPLKGPATARDTGRAPVPQPPRSLPHPLLSPQLSARRRPSWCSHCTTS